MVSCGGNERLKTVKLCRFVKPVPLVLMANSVPLPQLPPRFAVPYRVLPDKTNPATGLAPSVLVIVEPVKRGPVKLCRFVKPVPLVLMANTVPLPEVPPPLAVPDRVLPNNTNAAT